jgi:hypothetical protein
VKSCGDRSESRAEVIDLAAWKKATEGVAR